MLRNLLLAMGLMVVPALIVTVRAQSGTAPAKKVPAAGDDLFGEEAAPAAQAVKAKPKPKADAGEDTLGDNPFGGEPAAPAKAVKPKVAVAMPGTAKIKPATKKQRPAR